MSCLLHSVPAPRLVTVLLNIFPLKEQLERLVPKRTRFTNRLRLTLTPVSNLIPHQSYQPSAWTHWPWEARETGSDFSPACPGPDPTSLPPPFSPSPRVKVTCDPS